MNNLSIGNLSFIFKKLSINDLLNCRLVNKKFKLLSDHSNHIIRLIIGDDDYLDECYWWDNKEFIKKDNLITLECYRKIRLLSIFNLDDNLKYLKLRISKEFKIDKELSNLINLECIEIENQIYGNQIINFQNLKTLILINCYDDKFEFYLNTPKLSKIRFHNIKTINFISKPKSIKHLITSNYQNGLKIFKNLEILELNEYDKECLLDNDLLSIFKNLIQFKIYSLEPLSILYNGLKDNFSKILQKKINQKRKIDFYLEGVKILNINQFKKIQFSNSVIEYQLKNYDLLDKDLDWNDHLIYNELEDFVYDLKCYLPSDFFVKYSNIFMVNLSTDIKNIDCLNWFLKNLKNLTVLDFYEEIYNGKFNYNKSLDQKFYNNLPDTIKSLSIYSNLNINYDFIFRLKNLRIFSAFGDKDIFNLALKSFLKLAYLNLFSFDLNKMRIEIKKNDNGFDFDINFKTRKNRLNYYQLKELCNKIDEDGYTTDCDLDSN